MWRVPLTSGMPEPRGRRGKSPQPGVDPRAEAPWPPALRPGPGSAWALEEPQALGPRFGLLGRAAEALVAQEDDQEWIDAVHAEANRLLVEAEQAVVQQRAEQRLWRHVSAANIEGWSPDAALRGVAPHERAPRRSEIWDVDAGHVASGMPAPEGLAAEPRRLEPGLGPSREFPAELSHGQDRLLALNARVDGVCSAVLETMEQIRTVQGTPDSDR